jgi:hypothetical protein
VEAAVTLTPAGERMVAEVPERDTRVLADLIGEGTALLVTAARAQAGHEPIGLRRATVSPIVGLLALDHHLHGGQFSESSGSVWGGRVADMHSPRGRSCPSWRRVQARPVPGVG